jgi:hypothetical protein
VIAVILVSLLAAGTGGFLVARMTSPGPAAPSAKAGPKRPEAVAERPDPKKTTKPEREKIKKPEQEKATKPERVTPKEPEQAPAPPVAAPTLVVRGDDKPIVLTEFDKRLESYHKLCKPQRGEWKFADIPWEVTVYEARKKAAEEGKPLFLWHMAGEPLGQC